MSSRIRTIFPLTAFLYSVLNAKLFSTFLILSFVFNVVWLFVSTTLAHKSMYSIFVFSANSFAISVDWLNPRSFSFVGNIGTDVTMSAKTFHAPYSSNIYLTICSIKYDFPLYFTSCTTLSGSSTYSKIDFAWTKFKFLDLQFTQTPCWFSFNGEPHLKHGLLMNGNFGMHSSHVMLYAFWFNSPAQNIHLMSFGNIKFKIISLNLLIFCFILFICFGFQI